MITPEQAQNLATRWVGAWNAHDLDAILALYTDDFEMTSPYIVERGFDPSGTLKGKAAVGRYWGAALAKAPDLRFEPIRVLASPDSVALYYLSRGRHALEVFMLDGAGLIRKAIAHYADA